MKNVAVFCCASLVLLAVTGQQNEAVLEEDDDSFALLQIGAYAGSPALEVKLAAATDPGLASAVADHIKPKVSLSIPHTSQGSQRYLPSGIYKKHHAIVICSVVLVFCMVGSVVNSIATSFAVGAQNGLWKLTFLCVAFSLSTWSLYVSLATLSEELKAPSAVVGVQTMLTALFTVLIALIFWSRLTAIRDQVMTWAYASLPLVAFLVWNLYMYRQCVVMFFIISCMKPLATLPLEHMLMTGDNRPHVNKQIICAYISIVLSGIVYMGDDWLHLPMKDLGIAMVTLCLGIVSQLTQRRLLTTSCRDLSIETCTLVMNLLSQPLLCLIGIMLADPSNLVLKDWLAHDIIILLLLSGLQGAFSSFVALTLQREIAATSVMVLEHAVCMSTVVVGIIVFSEPIRWPWQGLGLILGFSAALWFAKAQTDGVAELKVMLTARRLEATRLRNEAKETARGKEAKNSARKAIKEAVLHVDPRAPRTPIANPDPGQLEHQRAPMLETLEPPDGSPVIPPSGEPNLSPARSREPTPGPQIDQQQESTPRLNRLNCLFDKANPEEYM